MTRLTTVLLGLFLWASVAQAQTTIYWKKDYIRDASGAAIAIATPAPSDTEVPSTPGTPTQSTVTTSSVTIAWSSSTDSGGAPLAGYIDDTIALIATVMKAVHVTELRTAVNAVRAASGLSAGSWTNSSISGAWVDADDILDLRNNLGPAINALALVPPHYIDSVLTGATIKKSHIEQLRQRVK